MAVYSYRTIQAPAEGGFKEKGSRFLAYAYPVDDEAAIRTHLQALRKKYFDARHHCYAWVLGADKTRVRTADDGEPNHSAGDPILGQIRSGDLTNVLIVVVRYFGGIKLGVGGLITAYREAAADVLRSATIIEEEVMVALTLTFPYVKTPEVMRLLKDFDISVIHQAYDNDCVLNAKVPLRNHAPMLEKIHLLNAHEPAIVVS